VSQSQSVRCGKEKIKCPCRESNHGRPARNQLAYIVVVVVVVLNKTVVVFISLEEYEMLST
jgi:hypothetical protein